MSRIGNKPVLLQEAKAHYENSCLTISGKNGEIKVNVLSNIKLELDDTQIVVSRIDDTKKSKQQHGLVRSLINNAVIGVTTGYSNNMYLKGVGYRVQLKGKDMEFSLGYSHPVVFHAPEGIEFKVVNQTTFSISSPDKALLGKVSMEIKRLRKVDVYKGKGIFFEGEEIKKKAGKTVAK